MIVFEVGSGSHPILVKQALRHVANDVAFSEQERSRLLSKGFEVEQGSIFDIQIEPESVDVVLTRNVFSCGYFGYTDNQYTDADKHERDRMSHMSFYNKKKLLQIASEILVTGGSLVVFDWNTPHVTERDLPYALERLPIYAELQKSRPAVESVLGADFVLDVLVATPEPPHYIATVQKQ